ncbi:MAG: fatty acid desaturase family protein [Flavobacteriales bacterium]
MKKAKFDKNHSKEFITDLRQSVDEYFKSNKITRFGNTNMILKSIFMISLYAIPYIIMISGVVTNSWLFWMLWLLMGVGMAGIGLSVMHDANHGAFSKHKFLNTLFGLSLNFLGGSAKNWKIQHNRLHHTFTNIDGLDPDVTPVPLLRFSPTAPIKKIHKFQHIYAWFFYCLMTISWATNKEFKQLNDFRRDNVITKKEYLPLMLEMIAWKIVYYLYMLVIPMMLIDSLTFGFWLVCFVSLHFVAGFILATIFQTAHIMPDCEYPTVNNEGTIENNWAIHQLQTTSNYAPQSKFFSWFIGGLNFQVEHHLFPNICHVHYQDISKIVKAKAKKYNLPYYTQKNYATALGEHFKMLKKLGEK